MDKLVLIADDDFKNTVLIRDLLQTFSYTVIEATNGSQAVELARTRKPYLILMDIHMPVMDGLQATRILKNDAATKEIPIVALTASATRADRDKVLQAGCDEFITKPINIKAFLNTVSHYFTV